MKTSIALALSTVLAAFPAVAEQPAAPMAGMRGPRASGSRPYDPKTVTTLSGEIVAVEKTPRRRSEGVHLQVKTADGTVAVHLGPAWFLAKQDLQLAQGDRVEITGSKVTLRGGPAVIAQVVKKGDKALALRDVNGIPVWAGRGRR